MGGPRDVKLKGMHLNLMDTNAEYVSPTPLAATFGL